MNLTRVFTDCQPITTRCCHTAACNVQRVIGSTRRGYYSDNGQQTWDNGHGTSDNGRSIRADSPTKFRLNVERSLIVYAGIPLYCFKCCQFTANQRSDLYILYLNCTACTPVFNALSWTCSKLIELHFVMHWQLIAKYD